MRSFRYILLCAFALPLSLQAHELGKGRFDTSDIRQDVIQFVRTETNRDYPPMVGRPQTANERELQAWVEGFTQDPHNAAFFEGRKFTVRILHNDTVNASAAPNGQIYVYQGLMEVFKNDPQLIKAVLAHELAHVARAHSIRLAAEVIGDGPLRVNLLSCTGWELCKVAFTYFDSRRMGRAFEIEADQFAMEMLNNAGLDPALMPVALNAMGEVEEKAATGGIVRRTMGRAWNRVCGTHPETCERVSLAYKEIERHGYENAWRTVPKPDGAVLEWLKSLTTHVRL